MGARQKLNSAYVNGSLLIAGIAWLVTNSWPLFFAILACGLIASLCSGEIRPHRSK